MPVAPLVNGEPGGSTAFFSYPIGTMEMEGPLPWDGNALGDWRWYNGHGHLMSFGPVKPLKFKADPILPSPYVSYVLPGADMRSGGPPELLELRRFDRQPVVRPAPGCRRIKDLRADDEAPPPKPKQS